MCFTLPQVNDTFATFLGWLKGLALAEDQVGIALLIGNFVIVCP